MITHSAFPHLRTGHTAIDRAFRIALGDLYGNLAPYQSGLLERPRPTVLAGLHYDRPWTRDTAINTWNGAGLLFPEVTRNTLLSTLTRDQDGVRIDGQYWDAIIWAVGAWWQYVYTADREFLALALQAVRHSLAHFERTEFDPQWGLFRGPAVYGDGVAAYPDAYARTGGSSSILDWPAHNPHDVSKPGYGIPMMALSTNCVYYHAYVLAERMAGELRSPGEPSSRDELDRPPDPAWPARADALRAAINRHFWRADEGCYRYLVGPLGGCDHQEGVGQSLAILLGVADAAQAEAIFHHQHITPAGIPCVWPTFARYERPDGMSFGRHSGTVWPHIQGLWAHAAALHGREDLFAFELRQLAGHAVRDHQFAEIYHPLSGQIYGGLQEAKGEGIRLWDSCARQTWSATAFLRMILMGLLGMDFMPQGIRFQPLLPDGFGRAHLGDLAYRDMVLDVTVHGSGRGVARFEVDGRPQAEPWLPASTSGRHEIAIHLARAS